MEFEIVSGSVSRRKKGATALKAAAMTTAYGKKRYDRLWLGEGRARRGFLLN